MPFLPHESAAGGGDEPSAAQGGGSGSGSWGGERSPPPGVHPSGISKAWSMLYVWLQYAQWYKVLCWLLVLVLGGSEGLLPVGLREAFRVEELLLASESRAQTFIFGQCVPFVLTKTRHFLVTWAGHSHVVRLIFYSAFTSHVEVASTLACDSVVAVSDSRRVPPQPPRASPPLLLGLLPPPFAPLSRARSHHMPTLAPTRLAAGAPAVRLVHERRQRLQPAPQPQPAPRRVLCHRLPAAHQGPRGGRRGGCAGPQRRGAAQGACGRSRVSRERAESEPGGGVGHATAGLRARRVACGVRQRTAWLDASRCVAARASARAHSGPGACGLGVLWPVHRITRRVLD